MLSIPVGIQEFPRLNRQRIASCPAIHAASLDVKSRQASLDADCTVFNVFPL